MTLRAILWVAVSTKTQAADDRESLPSQERDLRALAEKCGWNVVDVLIVPGHSRRYVDIHECARDMAAQGIQAFHKLLAHWDAGDFDILAVRDSSRFGRTQSLHAYVVERTIGMNATIHSLVDGEINENNFRMFIAMGGYAAAGELDNLQKRREIGYDARAARGLPVNSKVVTSHKLIRDPQSGRAAKIVVDESRRQEWRDLVAVVCEGVAWKHVEVEMFKRYGYASPLGEPHSPKHYYRILSTPSFWGHSCRHFKMSERSAWVREPGHDIPSGILIHYNTFEPALTGELAERLKAELARREQMRGKMRPARTYKFSGLLMCRACKYALSTCMSGDFYAWRCMSKYDRLIHQGCPEYKLINEKKLVAWMDARLRQWLETGEPIATLLNPVTDEQAVVMRITALRKEIADLQRQIQTMIVKQATADDSLRDAYDEALRDAGNRLQRSTTQLKALEQEARVYSNTAQQHAWEELGQFGLENLWKLSDTEINQWLFRLFGKYKLAISQGKVVGLEIPPKRVKRYK